MIVAFKDKSNFVVKEKLVNRLSPTWAIGVETISAIFVVSTSFIKFRNFDSPTGRLISNKKVVDVDKFMPFLRIL